ncbi:MAG: GntR family transcriptional regulator [Clostridia bacterium]|nr:GntR family transcriptional regulator [Clostridia bacterium]
MFQLDFKSGAPICDQIVNGFIKLKALGVLKGGDQLPSVRALASKFSINPNTVQKSYAILEANGIIYSVKGKGSFMSDDNAASDAVLQSAKQEFITAIRNATDLGLSADEMINLIKQHSIAKEDDAQ